MKKIYVVVNGGVISSEGYTSLKAACEEAEVSYRLAMDGRRKWIRGNVFVEIKEIGIVKMKSRGGKIKGRGVF